MYRKRIALFFITVFIVVKSIGQPVEIDYKSVLKGDWFYLGSKEEACDETLMNFKSTYVEITFLESTYKTVSTCSQFQFTNDYDIKNGRFIVYMDKNKEQVIVDSPIYIIDSNSVQLNLNSDSLITLYRIKDKSYKMSEQISDNTKLKQIDLSVAEDVHRYFIRESWGYYWDSMIMRAYLLRLERGEVEADLVLRWAQGRMAQTVFNSLEISLEAFIEYVKMNYQE